MAHLPADLTCGLGSLSQLSLQCCVKYQHALCLKMHKVSFLIFKFLALCVIMLGFVSGLNNHPEFFTNRADDDTKGCAF